MWGFTTIFIDEETKQKKKYLPQDHSAMVLDANIF